MPVTIYAEPLKKNITKETSLQRLDPHIADWNEPAGRDEGDILRNITDCVDSFLPRGCKSQEQDSDTRLGHSKTSGDRTLQELKLRKKKLSSKFNHGKFTGLARLAGCGVVLADEHNCCLVLMTESYQIVHKLRFDPQAKPWIILTIRNPKVACALRYEDEDFDQIVVIKIHQNKLKIMQELDLPYECFCIQLPNSNILASARNDAWNWILLEVNQHGTVRRKWKTVNGKKLDKMKRFAIKELNSVSSHCARGKSSIARKPEVHPKIF